MDTQTENGQIDPSELITTSSNTSGLSSRSQSTSPSWPIAPGGITTESRTSSRCSSGGGRNQESESPENANGQSKFSSSPKPSFLARGPPDGAEKVPSHVENAYR